MNGTSHLSDGQQTLIADAVMMRLRDRYVESRAGYPSLTDFERQQLVVDMKNFVEEVLRAFNVGELNPSH